MLEAYVSQQVRDGTYDLDANMALLKLYQFYPDRVRYEVCSFLKCSIRSFIFEINLSHKLKMYPVVINLALNEQPAKADWSWWNSSSKKLFKIILAVLLKGMMRLPEPDFVMYKALLASLNDPDMDKNVKRALGEF